MSVRRVACRAAVSMSRGMLVNIGPISQPTPVGILRESVSASHSMYVPPSRSRNRQYVFIRQM